MIRIFFVIAVLVPMHLWAANGWIGSGGDMITDEKNPWWIQSKSVINYCIEFDHSSMSGSLEDAEKVVKHAFNNWLTEWRYFNLTTGYPVKVGQQTLVYNKACLGNEDVVFHFGWGSLVKKQKDYLKTGFNIKKRGGAAVRTEYDPINMIGKGFIYISSDLGPNKLDLGPKHYAKPWRYKFLLNILITHELGHLFGIRHNNTFTLMREDFLTFFLEKPIIASPSEESGGSIEEGEKERAGDPIDQDFLQSLYYIQFFSNRTFVRENWGFESELDEELEKLFGMDPEDVIQIKPNPLDPVQYDFFQGPKETSLRKTHTLVRTSSGISWGTGLEAIEIYVPPGQTVIINEDDPRNPVQNAWIPISYTDQFVGQLKNLSTGNAITVFVSINRDSFVIRGVIADKAYTGFFWANYWKPVVETLNSRSKFIRRVKGDQEQTH